MSLRVNTASNNAGTSNYISVVQSRRSATSVIRLYGAVGKDTSTGRTSQLIMRAPAHFDAVRINVLAAASEGYAWKVTVAPSASRNLRGPLDSVGSAIIPTVVTFGSTDRRNPRNPGGGAVTVTSTGASGTTAANNLVQDRICSDVIQIKSLDRVDVPSNPPLLYVRIYGQNIPIMSAPEMRSTDANSWASTVLPEFAGGYLSGDYSVTNPVSDFAEFGWPAIEVEFFLRGKQVRNIGITGDSTDQGWVRATAVPRFGGNINGYMRKFVDRLRAGGEPVGFSCFAVAGQHSFMTYNNALPAVLSGELTHLVIRPFSINDTSDGSTLAVAQAALQRTSLLIQTCKAYGVVPILLRPFACGIYDSIQYPAVKAYVDSYAASGGLVLDLTPVFNASGSLQNLKPEYLTKDSSGIVVDNTHPNEAGHQAAADYIYSSCSHLFV